MTLAYRAMEFAREVHKEQRRKYTGNPYVDHLAEVAGIAASVSYPSTDFVPVDAVLAVCWLHDCVEDQGISYEFLCNHFGVLIAGGVLLLSDLEKGNRAERKQLARERLARAPGWVQTIKVADLISNTSSIVEHDPDFAVVYLKEKQQLLDVLTAADERLVAIARSQVDIGEK